MCTNYITSQQGEQPVTYCVPRRPKTYERDFMVEGHRLWNQIPFVVRQLELHEVFKEVMKTVTFT